MQIAETFAVAAPIERVWRFITDPTAVAPCVPGCQSYEVLGPKTYKATVKVALGPIKTTFNVIVDLTTEQPPTFLASTARGEEGGKASTLTAHNELRLAADGPGATTVSYSSEVALVGRLGKFGLGIMKKKAKTIGEEFAVAFRARVEAAEAVRGGTTREVLSTDVPQAGA
jgi:carbon monoxide dehydrogenase subunit G